MHQEEETFQIHRGRRKATLLHHAAFTTSSASGIAKEARETKLQTMTLRTESRRFDAACETCYGKDACPLFRNHF